MRFYRTFILILLIATIVQYFTQKEVQAYSSCDQTKLGSEADRSPAVIQSPEKLKKISYWTDYFFYLVRPEMRDKKIQVSQALYRREKTGIRQVVRQVFSCSCYWSRGNYYLIKKYIPEDKQNKRFGQWEYYWLRNDDYWFDGLYSDFTDAVFYARHPELNRDDSNFKNMNLATERIFIRQHLVSFDLENSLKQEFIPPCSRDIANKVWTSPPDWYLEK